MTTHRAIADRVRVSFKDGTSTTIYVLDDESIQERIDELCEQEGWKLDDVAGYKITGQAHADDFGIEED
jgi:hypothetical protein